MRGLRPVVIVLCCLIVTSCARPTGGGTGSDVTPDPRTVVPCRAAGQVTPDAAPPSGVSPPDDAGPFAEPLVITDGGTYQGSWESQDADVPVIEIRTTDPVVIEDSDLRGRGPLIAGGLEHVDLTVRNTTGEGLHPLDGATAGRFLQLHNAANVRLENNEIRGTAGIRLDGFGGSPGQGTFKILNNRVTNIDGRRSTGAGFSTDDKTAEYVQFVQFALVTSVPGIEVGWNEVRNDPGASRVEDVISVYLSSGTQLSPISIHDNFIDGAYPTNARSDPDYSGGGIMLGDGDDPDHQVDFVQGVGNTVVNTTNYGVGVSAGHHLLVRGNRVLSTGTLPDGTIIPTQNVGLYVLNIYDQARFGPIDVVDNMVGWEQPAKDTRNDYYTPGAEKSTGNGIFPEPVGESAVADEFRIWSCRAAAAMVSVGRRE